MMQPRDANGGGGQGFRVSAVEHHGLGCEGIQIGRQMESLPYQPREAARKVSDMT